MKFRTISENPKRAFFFLNPFLHFWNFLQMLIKKLTNKSIHISFRILCMCLIEVVTCATPIRDTEAGADMGGLPQYTSILPASPPTPSNTANTDNTAPIQQQPIQPSTLEPQRLLFLQSPQRSCVLVLSTDNLLSVQGLAFGLCL